MLRSPPLEPVVIQRVIIRGDALGFDATLKSSERAMSFSKLVHALSQLPDAFCKHRERATAQQFLSTDRKQLF